MAQYGNNATLLETVAGGNVNSSYRIDTANTVAGAPVIGNLVLFNGINIDFSGGTLECNDMTAHQNSQVTINEAEVIIRNGSTNLGASDLGALYGNSFSARDTIITFSEANGETKLFGGTTNNGTGFPTCLWDLENVTVRRINGLDNAIALAQVQNSSPGSRFVGLSSGALTVSAGTLWEDIDLDGIRERDSSVNFVTLRHSNQPATGANVIVLAHLDLTLAVPFAGGTAVSALQTAEELAARETVGRMQSRFIQGEGLQMNLVNPVNTLIPWGRRRSDPNPATQASTAPGVAITRNQAGQGIRSWQYWNPEFIDNFGNPVEDITFSLNGDSVYAVPPFANLTQAGFWASTTDDRAYNHVTGNGLMIWRSTMDVSNTDIDTGFNDLLSRAPGSIMRSAPTTTAWSYRSRLSSLTPYTEAAGTIVPGVNGFGFGVVPAPTFAIAGSYIPRAKNRGGIEFTEFTAIPVFANPITRLAATISEADTLTAFAANSINDIYAALGDLYDRNDIDRDFTLDDRVFTIPHRITFVGAGAHQINTDAGGNITDIRLGLLNTSVIGATTEIGTLVLMDGSDISEGNWLSTGANRLTITGDGTVSIGASIQGFNTFTGVINLDRVGVRGDNIFEDDVTGLDVTISGPDRFEGSATFTGTSAVGSGNTFIGPLNTSGLTGNENTFSDNVTATGLGNDNRMIGNPATIANISGNVQDGNFLRQLTTTNNGNLFDNNTIDLGAIIAGNTGNGNSFNTLSTTNLGNSNTVLGAATVRGTTGHGNNINGQLTANGDITIPVGGTTNTFGTLVSTRGDLIGLDDTNRNVVIGGATFNRADVVNFNTIGANLVVVDGNVGNVNRVTGETRLTGGFTIGDDNIFTGAVIHESAGDGSGIGNRNIFNDFYSRPINGGDTNYTLGDDNQFLSGADFESVSDDAIGGNWSGNTFRGSGPALAGNNLDTNINGAFNSGPGNTFFGSTLISGAGVQVLGFDTTFTTLTETIRLTSEITIGDNLTINVNDGGSFTSSNTLTTGVGTDITAIGTGILGFSAADFGTGSQLNSPNRVAFQSLTVNGGARFNAEVAVIGGAGNFLALGGTDNRFEGTSISVTNEIIDNGGEHRFNNLTATGRVTVNNDCQFTGGPSFNGGLTAGTGTTFRGATGFGAPSTIGVGASIGGTFNGLQVTELGSNAVLQDNTNIVLNPTAIRPNLNVATGSTLLLNTGTVTDLDWTAINLGSMIGTAFVNTLANPVNMTIPDDQVFKVQGLVGIAGQTITLENITYMITGAVITVNIQPDVSLPFLRANGGFWSIYDHAINTSIQFVEIGPATTLEEVTLTIQSSQIGSQWVARYLPTTNLADLNATVGLQRMAISAVRTEGDTIVAPQRLPASLTGTALPLPAGDTVSFELDGNVLQISIDAERLGDTTTQGGVYIAAHNSREYFDMHLLRDLRTQAFIPSSNSGSFTEGTVIFLSSRDTVPYDPDGTGPAGDLQVIPSAFIGQYNGDLPTRFQFARQDVISIPDSLLSRANTEVILSDSVDRARALILADTGLILDNQESLATGIEDSSLLIPADITITNN